MYHVRHDTLRYYDKIGLLKPTLKKDNGYRYYTIRDLELLEFILLSRQLDIPLKRLQEFLNRGNIDDYIKLFSDHESFIEEKIKQLNELKKEVSRFKQKTIAMRNFVNRGNIDDYIKLFSDHESFIEEKIKQLNELKKEVSRFKQKTIAMRNFENDELPEIPTYESIDKTLLFISQKGDESLAEIVKNKDLILITKYNEEGALIVDSSLIGFEIFEDESFDIEKYKNYMKYHLKGRYMTFSRKGTVGNMIDFINAAMSKYGIEDEVLPIIECTFNMVRLDESAIHFAKIYIPIHE